MAFPEGLKRKYDSYRARLYKEKEIGGWREYNSPAATYGDLFAPVLSEPLPEGVRRIKTNNGGSFVGMDLCGQGDCLEELGVTKGLSVCLSHDFSRCKPPSGTIDKWDANLMEADTWKNLNKWTEQNGNPDLIICAPGGGHDGFWNWGGFDYKRWHYQHGKASFFVVLREMIGLLSVGGTLLVDIQHSNFGRWLEKAKASIFGSLPGNFSAEVDLTKNVMSITKDPPPENPDILEAKVYRVRL